MLGVIPAAGAGTRIQPLAFSKELLPVGSRVEGGVERPRAVCEYLVERMLAAGATRLCFVIAPGKSDILHYFGGSVDGVPICYAVQVRPAGLCDALFCALPHATADESIVVGLPDTVWFPVDGLRRLPDDTLSFLLFDVAHPELFDAVLTDGAGWVQQIDVKSKNARSNWVWGAFKLPATELAKLRRLWDERDRRDEFFGTLVNAHLERGGRARGVRAGEAYVDVGTLHGYREALRVLGGSW
ncbi:MAG TPA: sugar phosphate nucleotidyltransferase [Polyangia bacterium]|nr:sugar phosphate nucleotidyltransferase [Polyangia bacterium]